MHLKRGAHVHHSGERIVAGLPTIDVVVRVDDALVTTSPAQELSGAIGDDLETISQGQVYVSKRRTVRGIR